MTATVIPFPTARRKLISLFNRHLPAKVITLRPPMSEYESLITDPEVVVKVLDLCGAPNIQMGVPFYSSVLGHVPVVLTMSKGHPVVKEIRRNKPRTFTLPQFYAAKSAKELWTLGEREERLWLLRALSSAGYLPLPRPQFPDLYPTIPTDAPLCALRVMRGFNSLLAFEQVIERHPVTAVSFDPAFGRRWCNGLTETDFHIGLSYLAGHGFLAKMPGGSHFYGLDLETRPSPELGR